MRTVPTIMAALLFCLAEATPGEGQRALTLSGDYARTHDPSTMGVATGTKVVSTNFDVPKNAETGASSLVVVANGIPSAPVTVTVK